MSRDASVPHDMVVFGVSYNLHLRKDFVHCMLINLLVQLLKERVVFEEGVEHPEPTFGNRLFLVKQFDDSLKSQHVANLH